MFGREENVVAGDFAVPIADDVERILCRLPPICRVMRGDCAVMFFGDGEYGGFIAVPRRFDGEALRPGRKERLAYGWIFEEVDQVCRVPPEFGLRSRPQLAYQPAPAGAPEAQVLVRIGRTQLGCDRVADGIVEMQAVLRKPHERHDAKPLVNIAGRHIGEHRSEKRGRDPAQHGRSLYRAARRRIVDFR